MAHEYGHHVENILGILAKGQDGKTGPQSGGVRIELMADCMAGVWANHASTTKDANGNTLLKPLTDDDIESALSAASAVGDDHIQEHARRWQRQPGDLDPRLERVPPEVVHRRLQERQRQPCDTFATNDL